MLLYEHFNPIQRILWQPKLSDPFPQIEPIESVQAGHQTSFKRGNKGSFCLFVFDPTIVYYYFASFFF